MGDIAFIDLYRLLHKGERVQNAWHNGHYLVAIFEGEQETALIGSNREPQPAIAEALTWLQARRNDPGVDPAKRVGPDFDALDYLTQYTKWRSDGLAMAGTMWNSGDYNRGVYHGLKEAVAQLEAIHAAAATESEG